MSAKIVLQIAAPCDQSWQQMSAAEQGKFCSHCSKKVIDFSAKTDAQILAILSNETGTTCGRFTQDQLQRPLERGDHFAIKPYQLLIAALIPAVLVNGMIAAQRKDPFKQFSKPTAQAEQGILMGNFAPRTVNKSKSTTKLLAVITGKVLNEWGEPVPYASVWITDTQNGAVANEHGHFTLTLWTQASNVLLSATAIGSTTVHQQVKASEGHSEVMFRLVSEPVETCKEVMTSKLSPDGAIMGEIAIVKTPSIADTVKLMVARLTDTQMFAAYPNPAAQGGVLHLMFKKPESCTIRLFDNTGKLYLSTTLPGHDNQKLSSLTIPHGLPKGNYYLQAVAARTGKHYTTKIIIQ